MGKVIVAFELDSVTPSEATQRMNTIKAKLFELTPGAGETLKLKQLDYRAENGDLDP